MQFGRQLPHRLAAALLLAAAATACVSDRYVGSIGRDGTYSNRGYGVAIPLVTAGLDARWTAIDPAAIDDAPPELRPTVHDEPIDLDGDGLLDMGETTRFLRPMLRLMSSTSTGALMSVDVTILGKNNQDIGLEGLLFLELAKFEGQGAATSTTGAPEATLESSKALEIPSGYEVRVAEIALPQRSFRVALVDQNDFTAEGGARRRQIVRVMLSAAELTDRLRQDQELLLRHLYLARKGGSEGSQEKW